MRKHSHFQMPPKNQSLQTHLVLLCCIKRLCISGPKALYKSVIIKLLLQTAEPIVQATDVSLSVWMCVVKLFKSLLLQSLPNSHKTWHTWSMCQCRKKTVEQIFVIWILKCLAIFFYFMFGLSLWNSSSGTIKSIFAPTTHVQHQNYRWYPSDADVIL